LATVRFVGGDQDAIADVALAADAARTGGMTTFVPAVASARVRTGATLDATPCAVAPVSTRKK